MSIVVFVSLYLGLSILLLSDGVGWLGGGKGCGRVGWRVVREVVNGGGESVYCDCRLSW